MSGHKKITRRAYLVRQALMVGGNAFTAIEAVSSVLLEHPEIDPDEKKTEREWQEIYGEQ
jgi:hypothetical protein